MDALGTRTIAAFGSRSLGNYYRLRTLMLHPGFASRMLVLCLGCLLAAVLLSNDCHGQIQMAGLYEPAGGGMTRGIPGAAPGSEVSTRNFIIRAPNPQLAQQAARLAEQYRRDLSLEWLGYEIAPWSEKVPVQVIIDRFPGGETSFAFVRGDGGEKAEPIGWQMKVFGPPDRVLDAVLPHEITHTIFATHFGRPLPRWADEGACTTVEHESERAKNHRLLIDFLTTKPSRGIPFNRMYTMTEYPHDILPLYAQGYSLAKFLIRQKDRRAFVNYIGEGLEQSDSADPLTAWNAVTRKFYGYKDLSDLQLSWLKWVESGSPLAVPAPAGKNEPAATVASPSGSSPIPTESLVPQPRAAMPGEPLVANLGQSVRAANINGNWSTQSAPLEQVQQAGSVTTEITGSWYRQQMASNNSLSRSVPTPLSGGDAYRPGSTRAAPPEVILRRVVLPAGKK
jgi:hypothetical protein